MTFCLFRKIFPEVPAIWMRASNSRSQGNGFLWRSEGACIPGEIQIPQNK